MNLNNRVILPGETIGIVGGGQLGKMMTIAAKSMGFRVVVLDPTDDCPCGQVADEQIIGEYGDLQAIKQLAEKSVVITYEFENIQAEALEWLTNHAHVPQGTELLKITQDRIQEKAAIQSAGVDVAPYTVIEHIDHLDLSITATGLPAVLKTARGGYDGKGQLVIRNLDDIQKAQSLIDQGPCVLEKWIHFDKEISVIITRNPDGEIKVFPVAENLHQNNILHQTIVPAGISKSVEEQAVQKAKKISMALNLVGTLAVEMFVTPDEEIYINELAPRPHNSGHYSIEACETSQFEQHIRSIANWPLAKTDLLKPVVMVNILGQHQERLLERLPKLQDWKVHLYGKKEAKLNRKMGHVTLLRDTVESAIKEADESGIWELAVEAGTIN
ncbi:5-(carboxyamino)imidazole ribonucleotide synthase [Mesobacillus persicus]|uniref:N5-carboxyaminoimidazole ribonucleotide synthase n=1 Tax=Mesobacillus persicus TaxID=930146 RepID=A0A1H8CD36_9BACI|nr:5-(carboxyamino)imidazole ribonucleotide synthase [Mesobacillus persicus]SEM92178.1 5-(carboxyamino)imidazole ribonucleotide synthase [Mesobacillus persicus]